jgi:phosphate transport system substrate-binding protein
MTESIRRHCRWLACAAVATVSGASAAAAVQIHGAGATFPYPIYSKWFAEFNKLRSDVEINYQSLGSGAGIRQLINGTVFFGASDGPMTDEQLRAAPQRILHFPTVLGAVVPIYNLPIASLTFSGPVLADIYLGRITKWSDPAIVALNPGVELPSLEITVVHRAEGSGTTYIWTDYLAKVSGDFKDTVGVAQAVRWPTGLGARGNEGVAGVVKQTRGSIGYVEMVVAIRSGIAFGSVLDAAGHTVKATTESVTAAAAEIARSMPADFRVSITNVSGKGAYPIASFTWLLLVEDPKDKPAAKIMVEFLKWALTDGQRFAPSLGYAPLPDSVVRLEMAALARVKTS